MYMLVPRPETPIYAVPYFEGRRLRPVRLDDDIVVSKPSREQERLDCSRGHIDSLGIDRHGRPAPDPSGADPDREAVRFLGLAGVVLLPSGLVAAVYGCRLEPVALESARD